MSARTLQEVNQEGMAALVRELGPSDAIRFIQQFNPGKGDYTKERHKWLGHLTLDDIFHELEKMRERGGVTHPDGHTTPESGRDAARVE